MTGWEIGLLVWIAVIPAIVLGLGWMAGRRRRVRKLKLIRGGSPAPSYGAVIRSISSASGVRPAPEPRLRVERTR
jgi:hypothetical protein